jgi:RHS repeat-associated protein
MIPTLAWTPDGVRFIDQTKLPLEESYVLATTYEQVAGAIVTMVVRGAPAIGVSAAYGSTTVITERWAHTNVWAAGALMATYDNTGTGLHFYFNDPLGTRRAQTDSAGILEQTCQSLPYGDGLSCSGSITSPTEHHFTGKERDAESGNDYFGARYYASSMGRFMSPDYDGDNPMPIPHADEVDPQSLNLYGYAGNNPLSNVDPDGHEMQCQTINVPGPDGTLHAETTCAVKADPDPAPAAPPPSHGPIYRFLYGWIDPSRRWMDQHPLIASALVGGECPPQGCTQLYGLPWGMTGGLNGVPGLARMQLLSMVKDAKLANIINDLFKATSSFGNGGTADAIAYERATERAIGGVFHTQKGLDYSYALQKLINSGRLSVQDSQIAQWLYKDLQTALTYTGR